MQNNYTVVPHKNHFIVLQNGERKCSADTKLEALHDIEELISEDLENKTKDISDSPKN